MDIEKVIDDTTDRRQHERCFLPGELVLAWGDETVTGELGDISPGGVLGSFARSHLPPLLGIVSVEVSNGPQKISGVEGLVIRLQAVEASRECDLVKVAVKFEGQNPDKQRELRSFVTDFAGRRKESIC